VLAGRTGSLAPDEVILERAWDLENLAATYRELVERFDDRQPEEPRHRFEELVRLVHHWRRFPFLDPEIPHQLLPVDWVGLQAQELFEDRRAV
jgi:phenylacetic acid degradation operon negative regulatory protein